MNHYFMTNYSYLANLPSGYGDSMGCGAHGRAAAIFDRSVSADLGYQQRHQ